MKVTVTTMKDDIFTLDVSEDLELENFKAFCEVEFGIPAHEISITFNGVLLYENKKSLKEYGISDGDIVVLQRIQSHREPPSSQQSIPYLDFSNIAVPGTSSGNQADSFATVSGEEDPAMIRDMFLANPDRLALLKQNNPPLADALLSGDLEKFSKVLKEQVDARQMRERQRLQLLQADPFDVGAQRLIADEIKQKNIDANMEAAMEFSPETFGMVVMLYVDCKINGHRVKAFVDSGAQSTIMSVNCAERCNVMRLVDTRWAGIAKGVGTQKIIGRVHMAQIEIANTFLTTSFSVLEDQPMDILLGLDMLKRHQCCIDLKEGVLKIGTTGTQAPFLPESEIPACARLSLRNEEEAMRDSAREAEDHAIAKAIKESSQALSNSVSGPQSTQQLNEADVHSIVALGYPRDQVIIELRKANGNKDQAIAALIAKSLKF